MTKYHLKSAVLRNCMLPRGSTWPQPINKVNRKTRPPPSPVIPQASNYITKTEISTRLDSGLNEMKYGSIYFREQMPWEWCQIILIYHFYVSLPNDPCTTAFSSFFRSQASKNTLKHTFLWKPISSWQGGRVKNTQRQKNKKNYQQAFNLAHVLPVI